MAKAQIDVFVGDHGWRGRRPDCAIKLNLLTTPCIPLLLRTVRSGSSAPPLLSQDVAGRAHAMKPTSRTLLVVSEGRPNSWAFVLAPLGLVPALANALHPAHSQSLQLS